MLYIIISISLWMLSSKFTSADLVAERKVKGNVFSVTTISFLNVNTANRNQLIQFFDVQGIIPTGFDARTVRIEKQGTMDLQYSLQVLQKSGDRNFCNSLELEIRNRDLKEIYKGDLMDLNLQNKLADQDFEEWIVFLYFNKRDENLKNKTCNFDMYMRTYRKDPNEELKGLYATRTLNNNVSSGSW